MKFQKVKFNQEVEIENKLDDETDLKARSKKVLSTHEVRKFLTEEALLNAFDDWVLQKGHSYHVISFGDVDSLSYLLFIAKQQVIDYCILSTWAMGNKDIEQIAILLEKGIIKKMDFYVGEIFKTRYSKEHQMLKELNRKYGCRIVLFRNHSKVIAIKGKYYDCVIESSANVNRNPRCEQTCITLDTLLTDWYIDFFKEIKSFEGAD